MGEWFTIERLADDTYAISEWGHWEETHSYLLLGGKRALLIDTGLGVLPLRTVVETLTDLPVTAVLTHAHWDHIGGFGEFSVRAAHEKEIPWLSGEFPLPLSAVKASLLQAPCEFPDCFDPDGFSLWQGGVTERLADGATVDLGGRTLTALHTPGHSPGHLCWWEGARRTLYTGDLLYRGKLDLYYPTTAPSDFLNSVRRVAALPAETLRPGHHSLDVGPELTGQVLDALENLKQAGRLARGQGVLNFETFSLHL